MVLTLLGGDYLKTTGLDGAWDFIPGRNEDYNAPGLTVRGLDPEDINFETFPDEVVELFGSEESEKDVQLEKTKVIPKIRLEVPGNFSRFVFRHAGVENTLNSIASELSENSVEGVRVNPDFDSRKPNIQINPIRINSFLEGLIGEVNNSAPNITISHNIEGNDISGGLSIHRFDFRHEMLNARWVGARDGDRLRIMPDRGKILKFRFLDDPNYFKYLPLASPNNFNQTIPVEGQFPKRYNPKGNPHHLDKGAALIGLNQAQCNVIKNRTSADLPNGVEPLPTYNNVNSTLFRPFSCDCAYSSDINYCVFDPVKKHLDLEFKFLNYKLQIANMVFKVRLPDGSISRFHFPKLIGSQTMGSLLNIDPFTGEESVNHIFSIKDRVSRNNMEVLSESLGFSQDYFLDNLSKINNIRDFEGESAILASVKKVDLYTKEIEVGQAFAGTALLAALTGNLGMTPDGRNYLGSQEDLSRFMEFLGRFQNLQMPEEFQQQITDIAEEYSEWTSDVLINSNYSLGDIKNILLYSYGSDPRTFGVDGFQPWVQSFRYDQTTNSIARRDVIDIDNNFTREKMLNVLCTRDERDGGISFVSPNDPSRRVLVSTPRQLSRLLGGDPVDQNEFSTFKDNFLINHHFINCGGDIAGDNEINITYKDSRQLNDRNISSVNGELRSYYPDGVGLQMMTNMDLGAYSVQFYSPSFSEQASLSPLDILQFGYIYAESPALMDWTKKFDKWYNSWFGWFMKLVFKLLEWALNLIANVIFNVAGLFLNNNALLVDFDRVYIGLDSVIYPEPVADPNIEDSYFKKLNVKGRRAVLSYPHVTDRIVNVSTIKPFQNCREAMDMFTGERMEGPRDFFAAVWSSLKCIILDPILLAFDVVLMPIKQFFATFPRIIYSFLTWDRTGFLASEIQNSIAEYESENSLLVMINGVLNQVSIPSTELFTVGNSLDSVDDSLVSTNDQLSALRSNPAVYHFYVIRLSYWRSVQSRVSSL